MKDVLAPTRESFTDEQVDSLKDLVRQAARIDGPISGDQHEILAAIDAQFVEEYAPQGKWS